MGSKPFGNCEKTARNLREICEKTARKPSRNVQRNTPKTQQNQGLSEDLNDKNEKFSRPPRCDHFDKPAYEILLNTWAFEVARRRRIQFATFGSRRNKPAYFLKFVFRILALASIFGKAEIFLSQCKIVLLFKY